MGKFYAWVKDKGFEQLQEEIAIQLRLTPGEYDIISIIDRVSRRLAREYQLDYAKVETYLKKRYVGLE